MIYANDRSIEEELVGMNVHSDARNKEVSLSRIRQLASSGLALEPFVRTIFELIGDAVPSSPHRAIHAGGELSDSYICSTQEVENIVPLHNHYFVESSAEISGARFRPDLDTLLRVMPTRIIWTQPESFLPNLYRAEGYNEAYRPLGWSHYTAVVFSDGHEYVGYYGMWRSADQKPFSREDIEFLRASARHVTHGLKVAQGAQAASTEPDGFAPLPAWGTGVVLIDSTGKPIAMDSAATLIFQQLGVLDGISA